MKSLKTLAWFLRILGGLNIVIGSVLLIGIPEMAPKGALVTILFVAPMVLWGIAFLSLAQGFIKKEKLAWYSGFILFGLSILSAIISIFTKSSPASFFSGFISFLFFLELIEIKELFVEQPQEKIYQLFHKSYFLVMFICVLLSYICMGILIWLLFFSKFLFAE